MTTSPTIPFGERASCTVAQAIEATGIGRTKIYEAIADGRLKSTKFDKRRLIVVASLLALVGVDQEAA
jgi:excisionase family DNA binding protein